MPRLSNPMVRLNACNLFHGTALTFSAVPASCKCAALNPKPFLCAGERSVGESDLNPLQSGEFRIRKDGFFSSCALPPGFLLLFSIRTLEGAEDLR